jgi:hypothetical protein
MNVLRKNITSIPTRSRNVGAPRCTIAMVVFSLSYAILDRFL